MAETIKKVWATDNQGNKVAPATFMSQVYDSNGNTLDNYIQKIEDQMTSNLVKTTNEWYADSSYVPKKGEIIIFSDHRSVTDASGNQVYVPDFKIGDGVTDVVKLPFYSNDIILSHYLQIGQSRFDGSENVFVPIYDGSQI